MLNICTLMGRLVKDPELKKLENGKSVLSFNLAVNRPKKKDSQEQETDFVDCIAWEKTGEMINKYFKKGDPIILEGKIQTKNYEDKEGKKRKSTYVLVIRVTFCLEKKKADTQSKETTTPQTTNYNIDDLPF